MGLIDRIKKVSMEICDAYANNNFPELERCLGEVLERFDEMSKNDKGIVQESLFMALARREIKDFPELQEKVLEFMRRIKYPELDKLVEIFKDINQENFG